MKRLLRAEARKFSTVRAGPLLLVCALVVEVTFKALLAGLQEVSVLRTRADQIELLGPTLFLPATAGALGVLITGAEHRHRLFVGSFAVTPERGRVLLAQAIMAAVVGGAFGLAAAGTSAIVSGLVIDGRGSVLLDAADGWTIVLGTTAAAALLAAAGAGVAAVLRSQPLALGIVALTLLILAPLALVLAPEVAAFLPAGLASGLAMQKEATPELLGVGWSALVAAVLLGLLLAAASRSWDRADLS